MEHTMTENGVLPYIEYVKSLNERTPRRYFVTTLGCQQNEADSEKLRGLCEQMGYLPAASAEDAALILVNTCAIRRHAELKALSLIGTFKHVKTENPDTVIGVCGCMAAEPHIVSMLKTNFPYVNFTMEPNMLYCLPKLVATALRDRRRTFLYGEDNGQITEDVPIVRSCSHRGYVSIMYGCNNFCSYCIVPYVRGRERSRDSARVLAECKERIDAGCREITLLGQNVNSYRSDTDFAGLLRRIASLDGDFILRFMTSHPKDVSDGLIAAMHDFPDKIAPSFHLPLQSGSDRILKEMNRTYTSAHYLGIVDKLRAAVPGIAITTDIIVAFPGETEEDFAQTLDVVRRVGYDNIYPFIFSPREGTRAAKMENTVTEEEKHDRMARLLALQKEISYEKNLPYEHTVCRVLADAVSREDPSVLIGRTPSGKLVRFASEESAIGDFVTVRIDRATPFDLFGERI